MRIAACWKTLNLRPHVDPLTGDVREDPHGAGVSDADRSALEWALRLAEAWGGDAVVVTAGASAAVADPLLRDAVAAGALAARRVDIDAESPSAAVAAALAIALAGADVVVCGDHSLDRGTGSVPSFLAAELGAAEALGLVTLAPGGPGRVNAERRLDGGRRERLEVEAPCVLSVEGGVRLRRAALPAVRRAATEPVEVVHPPATRPGPPTLRAHGPYRPRPRGVPAPEPALTARERVLALTGALTPRTPPEHLVLDPAAAADHILELLRTWD